jgi:hypothetical protein
MQMMREGKALTEIRTYIDAEYSQYGPPTDTEPIQDEAQNSCSEQTVQVCGDESGSQSEVIDTNTLPQITVPEAKDD